MQNSEEIIILDLIIEKEVNEKAMKEKMIEKENILKLIKIQIKNIDWQLKNGDWNEDIKNNTEDKPYREGFKYGLNSAITDYFYPLIEAIVGKSIEDYYEELEKLKIK